MMRALTIATMLLCFGALAPAHARYARSQRSPIAPAASVKDLGTAEKMAAKVEKRRGARTGSRWAKGTWQRHDARRADRAN